MKIHLPHSAFLGNIEPFIRGFDNSNLDQLQITTNQKWVAVHPVVLVMVAALAQTVEGKNTSCEALPGYAGTYLERMGLFKHLGIDSGISIVEREPAGRFIPITKITTSDELTGLLTEMVPLLHLEPQQASSIRYIVSELVRNVLEHAKSQHGAFVAAQYHKKTNKIRIGIADTGIGIKAAIGQSHPTGNDLEALQLALTPGITGTTRKEGGTEQNAGAGLFFIKSIATANHDYFVIYSGNALYKLLKRRSSKVILHANPFEDHHSKKSDLPYWRGTVVGIDLTLDATEEFTNLLDLIRDTYSKAVRDRKKARRKKPKFI
ncbi:MAG: ATP-binding protein [Patescibacteria group bacterium]|nr:ATP-binding protein [Patescibacteria group bacterium]